MYVYSMEMDAAPPVGAVSVPVPPTAIFPNSHSWAGTGRGRRREWASE